MSLKSHFKGTTDDINFRCKSVTQAGVLVTYATTVGEVEVVANPSGKKVAGLLLTGVVNRAVPSNMVSLKEPTGTVEFPRNFSKNEVHTSGHVRLLKIGEAETNNVDASDTFAQGDKLYITANGEISKVQDNSGIEKVGHALAAKDSDGYLRVYINIQ